MIKQIKYNRLYFKLENILCDNIYSEVNQIDWKTINYRLRYDGCCLFLANSRSERIVVNISEMRKKCKLDEFDDKIIIDFISKEYNTNNYEITTW